MALSLLATAAMAALLLCARVAENEAAIDRQSVVRRHNPTITADGVDLSTMKHSVATLGNGGFAFSVDPTGLQSLNNTFKMPDAYPLLTMSNWGWHTTPYERLYPAQAARGMGPFDPHKPLGLNYTYLEAQVGRHPPAPRTVPYQLHCSDLNDPSICNYFHDMPARKALGQLAFVLPAPPAPPPAPAPPAPLGCSPAGEWCSNPPACTTVVTVVATPTHGTAPGVSADPNCSFVASASRAWRNKTMCLYTNGTLVFYPVDRNVGHFVPNSGCNDIDWVNTKGANFPWRRSNTPPPPPTPAGGPRGPFQFLDPANITSIAQELDLWTGALSSSFKVGGQPVSVRTVVDSDTDTVAVRYTSPAALSLGVQLAFCTTTDGRSACVWGRDDDHETTVLKNATQGPAAGRIDLLRATDADTYAVSCTYGLDNASATPSRLAVVRTGPHSFVLDVRPAGGGTAQQAAERVVEVVCRFELVCCVGTAPPQSNTSLAAEPVPGFAAAAANTAAMWGAFWTGGAFIDFEPVFATDPRARELERRVILSLYQLRAQEAGDAPPQESGLLYNSWTGKHHSEMRFWHQTWMPLWGHPELLGRSDQWYMTRLANATAEAARQGYKGARWGKMLGENNPRGYAPRSGGGSLLYWESPNDINPALVWHQPSPIHLAELEYRAGKTAGERNATLHRLQDVVLSTAAFLADFPVFNTETQRYDLGPPMRSSPETNEDPLVVWNPSFELVQFKFGIDLGNRWLERLGLPRRADWDHVRDTLSSPPTATFEGSTVYNGNAACQPSVFQAGATNCDPLHSHPGFLGALGAMPGGQFGVDGATMATTLNATLAIWDWAGCWGWDEPMAALTAVRLHAFEAALNITLIDSPTNNYCANGANCPSDHGPISAYFPGNGGLLLTMGMMAAGWGGGAGAGAGAAGLGSPTPANGATAPGFPPSWPVCVEGFTTPYF